MNKIGFFSEDINVNHKAVSNHEPSVCNAPRKSVVQVLFPERGISLAYYNDSFELKPGDYVYVEGKYEGILGRVTNVNYNFKIKLSDYKRVISQVDTEVHGQFFGAGSHFVTFIPEALPKEKVRTWFLPTNEGEEYITSSDDESFPLKELGEMTIAPHIAEKGNDYYNQNRVRYISVNGTSGYAIVEGSKPYEVEFTLKNGMVSNLVCSCLCNYNCKHEFAVMLQLNETISMTEKYYLDKYKETGYFAAVGKNVLFAFVLDGNETGSITL